VCGLTTATVAIAPENAAAYFYHFTWIVGVAVVAMMLSLERRKLMALLCATAVPLGLYAVAGGAWVLFTGGEEPLYGPRSADIWNNNSLGATLVALVPLFGFLARHAPSAWARRGAAVLLAAAVIAVLGTYSRGAALSLSLVLALQALCRQWRALAVAGAAFVVFMLFTTPSTWLKRVDTIRTYEQDTSASMRFDEWYVALRLGLDHPLLGAGFRPFNAEIYQRYAPASRDHNDAHNMVLQVFAEHGIVGLALYVALLASTFASLQKTARLPPSEAGAAWLPDAARALQIGLAGYIFDGMFHVLSYRPFFIELLVLAMIVDAVSSPAHAVRPLPLRSWLARALERTGIGLRLDPPKRAC
jgi:probable O-glycosylation ligase (exosortase A-associated)